MAAASDDTIETIAGAPRDHSETDHFDHREQAGPFSGRAHIVLDHAGTGPVAVSALDDGDCAMTMPTSLTSSAKGPFAEAEAEAIAMGGKHARRLTWLFALLLGVVAVLPVALIVGLAMRQVTQHAALTPYVMILATLLLTLLAAHLLLQHWIVRPSLALLRHIQTGGQYTSDRIPALWQPWFNSVSDAFASSRDFQGRLAASEERLKSAAESLPDGLAIFDAEDRLAFHNSRYPDHLTDPLRATMALGKRWPDWALEAQALSPIYHPDMGPDYLDARIGDRGERSVDREHQLIDGRWLRVRERQMTDGGRVLLTTDISEERQRKHEQTLLAAAVAQTGNSIEITTAEYRIHYINPAFSRLTGYSPREAIGRTPAQLLRSTEHDAAFFDEIDRVTRGGSTWKGRIVSRHKDGRLIHQDATISPIHDKSGRLTHFVAAKRDVTDKVNADAALRTSEARFLGAAESIPDGIAILDAEDRFVFFNSRYPKHLTDNLTALLRPGIRFDEWIDEALRAGPIYHPEMGSDFPARRLAMHREERWEHEHQIIDGRWLRIRESRMADGGRVLLSTDITERRRRERQLLLLAMAVEQVGDAVEITDAEGRFTYVNPAFTQTTGYEPAEVVGRSPQDVLSSGQHDPDYFAAIYRQLTLGDNWQGLIVNRRKNGELVHQDTTISPLRDAHGRITHYVAVRRDVTEQEKAEAAVRASEARYRAVVDTQTEFIARIAPDGRLNFVNDAYCRYFGRSREKLLGRPFNEFTLTIREDRERDEAHLASLSPTEPSRTIELRRQLTDGSVRWVQWADTAFFDDQGQLIELQSVGRDITEQRISELALLESEARYRALVETQTEFVLRQLPDGRLTFVNEAYCRYVGLPREAVLSDQFNGLDLMAPEYRPLFDEHQRRLTPDRTDRDHGDPRRLSRRVGALGALGRYRNLRCRRQNCRAAVHRLRHHRAEEGGASAQGQRGALPRRRRRPE